MTETPTLTKVLREIDGLVSENKRLRAENERLKQNRPNKPKLTQSDVKHIREMVRSGYSRRDVASAYDVNPSTVSRIVRGEYHR